MQEKTVFILQEDKESGAKLKTELTGLGYNVIGVSDDGITALSYIAEKKPSVVILGIILSGYDGLTVLKKMKDLGVNSKAIVLSSFIREEIIYKAGELGASYFMAKPYNIDVLRERIEDAMQGKNNYKKEETSYGKTSLEEKISKIFINVGIPPHIKGYSFLREGVKMAVDDPSVINNITKKLYPMIGEKYDTSASKVERAIRHAIEVAWNRGRIESINSILGVRAYVGAEKPTNGEFIALVADKMMLERA